MTKSMSGAISETNRRRKIQTEYNEANGITPTSIKKRVMEVIEIGKRADKTADLERKKLSRLERQKLIDELTAEMKEASRMLEFEKAIYLRDRIRDLKTTK
jgi:excinuclease ABC subunit B